LTTIAMVDLQVAGLFRMVLLRSKPGMKGLIRWSVVVVVVVVRRNAWAIKPDVDLASHGSIGHAMQHDDPTSEFQLE